MSSLVLDMVHHNPGEAPFQSHFLDPAHLVDYGYNGQVFKHLNCAATFDALGLNLFPGGSTERAWLDALTAKVASQVSAAKQHGLKVFYHIDLFVLPKRLVEHFRSEICDPGSGRILLDRPQTLELHRVMFDELFRRFPEVDGLIVRVGETYLFDTPFHVGNGPLPTLDPEWSPTYGYRELLGSKPTTRPWGTTQADTYVHLIEFLRHELCERHDKTLIFRTWDIYPDRLHACADHYLEMTDRIDPHANLIFSIKHTSLDFWRRVRPNECLTRGRHRQIIEVQCQREYEGKGAIPGYVMHGVIDGFEENANRVGLRDWLAHPLVVGVFGWSRGGGWYGPYIPHELWPDLNAFVLAGFASDPSRTEPELFGRYANRKLGLAGRDITRFRKLCVLSATAMLKGRHCEAFDKLLGEACLPTACWTRDDRLGGEQQLEIVLDHLRSTHQLDDALAEKAEAVELWNEASDLATEINWPAGPAGEFVKLSAEYGRRLFTVIYHGWRIMAAGTHGGTHPELAKAIRDYDASWHHYRELSKSPLCPSLYQGDYFSMPGASPAPGLDHTVDRYRTRI